MGAFSRCPVSPDLCPHGPQVEATEPQDVVVYDQSTRDASVLAADSFLSVLLSKLDGCFDSVAILTGELRGAVGHPLPTASSAGGQGRPGSEASGSTSVLPSEPATEQRWPRQCGRGRVSEGPDAPGSCPLPWAPGFRTPSSMGPRLAGEDMDGRKPPNTTCGGGRGEIKAKMRLRWESPHPGDCLKGEA